MTTPQEVMTRGRSEKEGEHHTAVIKLEFGVPYLARDFKKLRFAMFKRTQENDENAMSCDLSCDLNCNTKGPSFTSS